MSGMPRIIAYPLLVIGLIFTIAGFRMVVAGTSDGLLVTVFFGLCTIVAICETWPNLIQYNNTARTPPIISFPGPLVLHASQKKTFIVIVAAAVFAGSGLWILYQRPPDWRMSLILWPGIIMFGGSLPLLALTLLRPNSLQFQADGFLITQLWRRSFVRWSETGVFEVAAIPIAFNKMVVFDQAGVASSLNVKLTGRTSSLPDSYGLAPDALASLLNQWREQALSKPSTNAAI